MLRRNAIALCLALIASAAGAQQQVRFEVDYNLWDPDISGGIQIVEGGIGDLIDLQSDLGLAGDQVGDLRLTFHPSRRTEIRLSRLPLSYAGDQVVSRTIEFAGETFTVSTRVLSEINLDYVRAGFAWQFLSSSDRRYRIGPLLEVKGFQGDASLSAPDLGVPITAAEDFEAAFPSAGLAFDLEPTDRVHVFGEFTTLVATDVGDQSDAEIGVRVAVWGSLWVQGGFRKIKIDVVDEGLFGGDDSVDFDMDGIFFGAALRF